MTVQMFARLTFAVLVLATAAFTALIYWGRTAPPDPGVQGFIDQKKKVPAMAWLEANRNPHPFAGNRFRTAAEAKNFVAELLQLGATDVFVADPLEEPSRINRDGGPYADTLVVELPEDAAKRRAIFKKMHWEAWRQGFAGERDVGQRQALLWWD
jgi:hypothetical protein